MQLGWIRVLDSDHYDPANFRKALGYFDFYCQPVFQFSLLELREGRTASFDAMWVDVIFEWSYTYRIRLSSGLRITLDEGNE